MELRWGAFASVAESTLISEGTRAGWNRDGKRTRIAFAEVASWKLQAADAIAYAHARR